MLCAMDGHEEETPWERRPALTRPWDEVTKIWTGCPEREKLDHESVHFSRTWAILAVRILHAFYARKRRYE